MSSEGSRGSGSRENYESEGSERAAAQRCMHGCGGHTEEAPRGLSAVSVSPYLSGSQKTFPAVLPVNGARLKPGRSQQSKEPVSTRSCAREQMNSSLARKPLPALQTLALLGYHTHVPGCGAKARQNTAAPSPER